MSIRTEQIDVSFNLKLKKDLQEHEVKELFEELDYELNYGGIREDLIHEIDDLKDEVRYLKGELSIGQDDEDGDDL